MTLRYRYRVLWGLTLRLRVLWGLTLRHRVLWGLTLRHRVLWGLLVVDILLLPVQCPAIEKEMVRVVGRREAEGGGGAVSATRGIQ